jgi:selenocysteine lyase/cysteine desulfurase
VLAVSYPFTDRAAEDERLIAQGTLFDPLTRRVLRLAGLAPGMRVLDLGSGAGNVARLEGRVFPHRVEYNALPWKYAAGTPNILGAVISAQALRILLDLALTPGQPGYFGTARPIERAAVRAAMDRISGWNQQLVSRALDRLGAIDGITIYGPRDPARRTSLVAFNLAGRDPVRLAEALDQAGVESRAGCHCATLAHHALGLTPPASCRLSFYLYNTPGEVDRAADAVVAVSAGRPAPRYWFWSWRRRADSRIPAVR